MLPSLEHTRLLFLDGEFVELEPVDPPLLTLIPPDPIEMRDLTVELALGLRRATAVALDQALPVTANGTYRRFTLPRLTDYELVLLED
jgi:hypothetical protein